MRNVKTEYQEKFWDYNIGYGLDSDPYEQLVRNAPDPNKIKPKNGFRLGIEEYERGIRGKRTRRRERDGIARRNATNKTILSKRISNDLKSNIRTANIVSSQSSKLTLHPRVVYHRVGKQPIPIQRTEVMSLNNIHTEAFE